MVVLYLTIPCCEYFDPRLRIALATYGA